MAQSNYEKMAEQARELFLTYDQERMIAFHSLAHDEIYLYLRYLNTECRIARADGTVSLKQGESWQRVSTDDVMIIYDYLCHSLDEPEKPAMSGQWTSIPELGGAIGAYHEETLKGDAVKQLYAGRMAQLQQVCESMGGAPSGLSGDVSVILPIFDDIQILFQFWDADEEFPANYKFKPDKNILKLIHYETVWYVMGVIRKQLIEEGRA